MTSLEPRVNEQADEARPADETARPEAPQGWRRRLFSQSAAKRFRGVISLLFGIAVWEFIARVVVESHLFFVPLVDVYHAMVELVQAGELQHHAWVSFEQLVYGLALAMAVGVPLGIAIGVSRVVRDLVQPWISGLYSTPMIALAPIFILWLGIGMASKIAVVFIMALFPITINTTAGIKNTEQDHIDVARAFALSRKQVFQKVLLPSALSYIATGFRLAVGRGIVGVVVAEFFGSRAGLGHLILTASQAFRVDILLLCVIILAFFGIFGIGLIERLEKRLAPWREEMRI